MYLKEIISKYKDGLTFKRACWSFKVYAFFNNQTKQLIIIDEHNSTTLLTKEDILANDWEFINIVTLTDKIITINKCEYVKITDVEELIRDIKYFLENYTIDSWIEDSINNLIKERGGSKFKYKEKCCL